MCLVGWGVGASGAWELISEADSLQIIEEKMDLGWVMLGEMVHYLEEKKTKSLSNHKQRWILDG